MLTTENRYAVLLIRNSGHLQGILCNAQSGNKSLNNILGRNGRHTNHKVFLFLQSLTQRHVPIVISCAEIIVTEKR